MFRSFVHFHLRILGLWLSRLPPSLTWRQVVWKKRSSVFWDVTQRGLVVNYRRFETTYRPHLQGSMGPICCSETSVTTNPRCVTSQKTEYYMYTMVEAWNHAKFGRNLRLFPRGTCYFVFAMEQNAEDGDRKFLRNTDKLLPDYTSLRCSRKWPSFTFILLLFQCLLQQLRFKFVRAAFVSVTGVTISYFGLLFPIFNDPLILHRKLVLVHTRQYFPCFICYCKLFLCSRMDSFPSVDSVPLECPYSHLTDFTTKMGPTNCIKTSFSRLAFCDVQAPKCLFHSHTAVHN